MSPTALEILESFENSVEKFSEYSIGDSLRSKKNDLDFSDIKDLAEYLAFSFCGDYPWAKDGGWGTYYGPMMVRAGNDGAAIETPSISEVTEEIISYWEARSIEARHPIIKRRYADLVWDFSKKVKGKGASYKNANVVIDCTIEIVESRIDAYDFSGFEHLRRSLDLSVSLKDVNRQEVCKNALIDFEKFFSGNDDSGGLWKVFDFLIVDKICPITKLEEESIIKNLNADLLILCEKNADDRDPWLIQEAATRLLFFYSKKGMEEKIDPLLATIELEFQEAINTGEPMQVRALLRNIYDLYKKYSRNEDADRLMGEINSVGPRINDSMTTFSASFNISEEKIYDYVENMTKGGLVNSVVKLILKYTPNRNLVVDQIKNLAIKAPMVYLFNHQILDGHGRVVANIGSVEEDLEGHVVRKIAQDLTVSSFFMRMIIEEIQKKYVFDESMVMEFIGESPLFANRDLSLLSYGLSKYFSGDLVAFSHVVVPQIESAIRVLLDRFGASTHKLGRNGEFFNRTLDEMLRDPVFQSTFENDAFLEDVPLYFRVLLTDQRGFNFRNQLCHGLLVQSDIDQSIADRLLHLILILGLVHDVATKPE